MKDNNLTYKRRSLLFIICFFLSIISFSQDAVLGENLTFYIKDYQFAQWYYLTIE